LIQLARHDNLGRGSIEGHDDEIGHIVIPEIIIET